MRVLDVFLLPVSLNLFGGTGPLAFVPITLNLGAQHAHAISTIIHANGGWYSPCTFLPPRQLLGGRVPIYKLIELQTPSTASCGHARSLLGLATVRPTRSDNKRTVHDCTIESTRFM